MNFDWSDLAFGDKKPVKKLKATFIAAPRDISSERFTQIVKEYLPKGNIVLGLAKEDYIDGFENQPQFKTLQLEEVKSTIDKISKSKSKNKIYTISYFQRDADHVIEKLGFQLVVLINGSWQHAFHNRSTYYVLVNNKIPYQMVSPFTDENEARAYVAKMMPLIAQNFRVPNDTLSDKEMSQLAKQAAKFSFDYNFQTGAVLGQKVGDKYKLITTTFNKVVPYQTYAMHHGASREINFSPPNDLNHYDTVHAEVEMILAAQKQKLSLSGTSLFINLMPCPACARMFADTYIEEFNYTLDHSDSYAIKILEKAGKKVRRIP